MIAASRRLDHLKPSSDMAWVIEVASHGVPTTLTELTTFGRTLKRRAIDILDPQEPSTDASNTYSAPPSASATLPTTAYEFSSKPASNPDYTLKSDDSDSRRLMHDEASAGHPCRSARGGGL
jgi:hypothetical protein